MRVTIRDLEGHYNIGVLMIRIGFGGILYYSHCHNKESPK